MIDDAPTPPTKLSIAKSILGKTFNKAIDNMNAAFGGIGGSSGAAGFSFNLPNINDAAGTGQTPPERAPSEDPSKPEEHPPTLDRVSAPATKIDGENVVKSLEHIHRGIIDYLGVIESNNQKEFSYLGKQIKGLDATISQVSKKTDLLQRKQDAALSRMDREIRDIKNNFLLYKKKSSLTDDNKQDAVKVANKDGLGLGGVASAVESFLGGAVGGTLLRGLVFKVLPMALLAMTGEEVRQWLIKTIGWDPTQGKAKLPQHNLLVNPLYTFKQFEQIPKTFEDWWSGKKDFFGHPINPGPGGQPGSIPQITIPMRPQNQSQAPGSGGKPFNPQSADPQSSPGGGKPLAAMSPVLQAFQALFGKNKKVDSFNDRFGSMQPSGSNMRGLEYAIGLTGPNSISKALGLTGQNSILQALGLTGPHSIANNFRALTGGGSSLKIQNGQVVGDFYGPSEAPQSGHDLIAAMRAITGNMGGRGVGGFSAGGGGGGGSTTSQQSYNRGSGPGSTTPAAAYIPTSKNPYSLQDIQNAISGKGNRGYNPPGGLSGPAGPLGKTMIDRSWAKSQMDDRTVARLAGMVKNEVGLGSGVPTEAQIVQLETHMNRAQAQFGGNVNRDLKPASEGGYYGGAGIQPVSAAELAFFKEKILKPVVDQGSDIGSTKLGFIPTGQGSNAPGNPVAQRGFGKWQGAWLGVRKDTEGRVMKAGENNAYQGGHFEAYFAERNAYFKKDPRVPRQGTNESSDYSTADISPNASQTVVSEAEAHRVGGTQIAPKMGTPVAGGNANQEPMSQPNPGYHLGPNGAAALTGLGVSVNGSVLSGAVLSAYDKQLNGALSPQNYQTYKQTGTIDLNKISDKEYESFKGILPESAIKNFRRNETGQIVTSKTTGTATMAGPNGAARVSDTSGKSTTGGTLYFVPGMAWAKDQVNQAQAYAKSKGLTFKMIGNPGDSQAEQMRQLAELKKQGVVGANDTVLGYSRGGYSLAREGGFAGKEIIIGAPGTSKNLNLPGLHENLISTLTAQSQGVSQNVDATRYSGESADARINSHTGVKESKQVEDARAYLAKTASGGSTMSAQGVESAIARLHPEFAIRAAEGIKRLRANGYPNAGLMSAFRTGSGPTGTSSRFDASGQSLHSIGAASDFSGIGRPGSSEAIRAHQILSEAGLHGVYGPYNSAEWNHFQLVTQKSVSALGGDPREVQRLAGNQVPANAEQLQKLWAITGVPQPPFGNQQDAQAAASATYQPVSGASYGLGSWEKGVPSRGMLTGAPGSGGGAMAGLSHHLPPMDWINRNMANQNYAYPGSFGGGVYRGANAGFKTPSFSNITEFGGVPGGMTNYSAFLKKMKGYDYPGAFGGSAPPSNALDMGRFGAWGDGHDVNSLGIRAALQLHAKQIQPSAIDFENPSGPNKQTWAQWLMSGHTSKYSDLYDRAKTIGSSVWNTLKHPPPSDYGEAVGQTFAKPKHLTLDDIANLRGKATPTTPKAVKTEKQAPINVPTPGFQSTKDFKEEHKSDNKFTPRKDQGVRVPSPQHRDSNGQPVDQTGQTPGNAGSGQQRNPDGIGICSI